MSQILRLEKSELGGLIQYLNKRYELFGPKEINGLIEFARINPGDELRLDFLNTVKSPKDIFFAQTQPILHYKDNLVKEPALKHKPVAIFALHPCDAQAMKVLDKVFTQGKYLDPYWDGEYRDSLIFGIGCNVPATTCFCNCTGLGPFNKVGADIFLTDIGDSLIFEACSEKGIYFFKVAEDVAWKEPDADDLKKVEQVKETAQLLLSEKFQAQEIKSTLEKSWDNPVWDEIANRCLSCGLCSYLCPTCHCFDIQDEKLPGTEQGVRIRIWDSCMFSLFTKEASGHNPRPSIALRFRQRIMHKFNYFIDNFGVLGCVGCGRCVQRCPVNIDIREILKGFLNGKE